MVDADGARSARRRLSDPRARADRPRHQAAAPAGARRHADDHPLRQRRAGRAARRAAERGRLRSRRRPRCRSACWTAASSSRRATASAGCACSPITRSSAASGASVARGGTSRRRRSTRSALKPGDYVVHLEHGVGIYRGIETIFVGQSTVEVGGRRVRGRRPAERSALSHRPARALSQRRRRVRRRAAAAAAQAGRQAVGAAARSHARRDPGDDASSCSISTRGGRSRRGRRTFPIRRGSASSSRPSCSRTRPTSARRRRDVKRRHGEHAADGPPARRRRRLRQDGDRRPRRVQGGADRNGRSPCSCRRRFSPTSTRARSASVSPTFPIRIAAMSRFQNAKEQADDPRRAQGEEDRHRHRHAPAAQPRRRSSRISA